MPPSPQNYVSGTLIYIFVEMFVYFVYYRFVSLRSPLFDRVTEVAFSN